jgi:hypothetical protein
MTSDNNIIKILFYPLSYLLCLNWCLLNLQFKRLVQIVCMLRFIVTPFYHAWCLNASLEGVDNKKVIGEVQIRVGKSNIFKRIKFGQNCMTNPVKTGPSWFRTNPGRFGLLLYGLWRNRCGPVFQTGQFGFGWLSARPGLTTTMIRSTCLRQRQRSQQRDARVTQKLLEQTKTVTSVLRMSTIIG